MAIKNRMQTEPIPVVRQHRPLRVRTFTTGVPGRIVPVSAFGLLRGDSCSGRVSVGIEMNETFEILYNRMHARVSSWFVPRVALDRFKRNRTYFERAARGHAVTDDEGAESIPYIETYAFPATADPISRSLGLAAKQGALVSTSYRESYNQIVNYLYRNRSKSLDQRDLDDTSLAYALWGPNAFTEIVPDFDDGMISGELGLTIAGQMPVQGGASPQILADGSLKFKRDGAGAELGVQINSTANGNNVHTTGTGAVVSHAHYSAGLKTNFDPSELYVEMEQNDLTISLANIDQAQKLKAWAKLRERYEGHRDPYVLETLMAGLPIDDQAWYQPMLLDMKTVDIEQMKRMATNYDDMEQGMTNGVAQTTLGVNVPQNPFGGVVMMMIEFFPEQLYERQVDPEWMTTDLNKLPAYDQDVLNPMPVVEVKNGEVDVSHATPDARFGYARRNWMYANNPTRVGGDLYAPNATAATGIARRPIYATDVANPTLSEEFYLTKTLGREIFVDQVVSPFKIGVGGSLDVMGLTVIGEVHESEANYDAVRAEYPPLAPRE